MKFLSYVLFWALGIYLFLFAGRSTFFINTKFLQIERPLNAFLIAAVWVFVALEYIKFIHQE